MRKSRIPAGRVVPLVGDKGKAKKFNCNSTTVQYKKLFLVESLVGYKNTNSVVNTLIPRTAFYTGWNYN